MISLTNPPIEVPGPRTSDLAAENEELRKQVERLELENQALLTYSRNVSQFLFALQWYVASRRLAFTVRDAFYAWNDSVKGSQWFNESFPTWKELVNSLSKLTER